MLVQVVAPDDASLRRDWGNVGSGLAVGDHAMAIVVHQDPCGASSEYVVVPAESVVHTRGEVDDVTAATLPMTGLTARLALDALALPRGSASAVTGAAGVFGGYVIRLAKAKVYG